MTTVDNYAAGLLTSLTRGSAIRRLYIQGNTIAGIGELLDIPRETVRGIIKSYRASLKERDLDEWSEQVTRQLDRLDMIESEAWDQWTKSTTGQNTYEVMKYDEMTAEDQKSIKEAVNGKVCEIRKTFEWTVKTDKAKGNAQYLALVLSCVRERSKLLGLDQVIDEGGSKGDVPIVAVIVETRADVDRLETATEFLAINKIPD